MPTPWTTPDVGRMDISDVDTEDLFASPSRAEKTQAASAADVKSAVDSTGQVLQNARESADSRYENEEAREAALRKELESVRSVNEVIEGVVESLEKAKGNMEMVSRTVTSASTLLNTWIRILSQTEHNQRLILDPNWQGASQDIADLENESVLKQQAAERREMEEKQKQEAALRRAEEEERRRTENAAVGKTARGRGRGRGSARGGSVTGTNYVGVGGQGGQRGAGRAGGTGRPSTGIGRGIPGSTRGRGRGVR